MITKLIIAGLMLMTLAACQSPRIAVKPYAGSQTFRPLQPQPAVAYAQTYQPVVETRFSVQPSRRDDTPFELRLQQQRLATMAEIPVIHHEDGSFNLTAGKRDRDDWLGGVSYRINF